MNKEISSELSKVQSQVSQETSNITEVSRVKNQNQVDSSNQTTIESQMLVSGNSASESPNSKGNTNSFAYSENSKSDLFTLNSNKSNNSNEPSKDEQSNFANSQTSVLSSLPFSIVSEEQLNTSVDEFIQETSSVHFIRAQELLDCEVNLSYDLAVKTIKNIKKNEESGWVLIGIAAYRVRNNTLGLAGGAGKTAATEEGKLNAFKNLAEDCKTNGKKIAVATLYDYARRIKVLLEEPLEAFAGENEKTIRHERTVLMEKLFLLPSSFARTAVSTNKPLEALEIACLARAEKRNKRFTNNDFKKAIAHLKNNDNDITNDAAGLDDEPYNDDPVSRTLTIAPKQIVASEGDETSNFKQIFSSQINREAKRVKLDPEQIKNLYVSFLQIMLTTVQDMGVAK